MSLSEEQIAAYADGELTGEALAEAEAAIAADEALAKKVAAHRALKSQLGAHYAPVLDQPVPDHLTAMLKGSATDHTKSDKPRPGDNVVSFGAARQKRGLAPVVRRWAPFAGPAIAAALVLAVLIPGSDGNDAPDGYAGATLAAALNDQLVAEQSPSDETQILLSFENQSGQLCRSYRGAQAGGIACRDEIGWKIETEIGLGEAQSTEFRQAGSLSDLMQAAQDMAAGGALDSDQEEKAKAHGWR